MKLKFVVPLLLFVALGIFLLVGLFRDPRYVPSPLIRKPAPEFTLPSLQDANYPVSSKDDIVPDLLELENMAVAPPEEVDPERLLKEGVELWQHGRIGEALACVFAVREASSRGEAGRRTRQRVLLSFSIMARHLGKISLAERLVHDVLKDHPDAEILPKLLIQAAAVWEDLGAIVASLAFAERTAAHIEPTDARRLGWVMFQKARCLCAIGQLDAAFGQLDEAERRFAECGDIEHEIKAGISRSRAWRPGP